VGVHQGGCLRAHLLLWQVQARDVGWAESLRMLLLLGHNIIGEEVPKFEADLKQFLVLDATHLRQIRQTLQGLVTQHLNLVVRLDAPRNLLDVIKVVAEDGRDRKRQLFRKSFKAGLIFCILHAQELLVERAALGCDLDLLKHDAVVVA